MDKDTRRILAAAREQGFEVRITSKGHGFVTRDGRPVATASGSTSDHRSRANLIAQLRRHGFEWPPRR